MKKPFCLNIQTIFFVIILFFILHIVYLIIFSHEAFCMDTYKNITSDEDVHSRLIISRKEEYISYSGNKTYNTRSDLFGSLYPNGLPLDYSIVNDYYDGENYFDIPLKMVYGGSENIGLTPGIYSGCMSRNIDGLLI
jgi:hypothetical protein